MTADRSDDTERLRPLLDAVAARSTPSRTALVQGLAVAAYRRAPADVLADLDVGVTAARLTHALEVLDTRTPGAPGVAVFTPTVAQQGWEAPVTVVVAATEDGPFLLSTLTEELGRLGLDAVEIMHPVVGVQRDADGRISALVPARGAAVCDSFIEFEIPQVLDDERVAQITTSLTKVITDAIIATRDYGPMRELLAEIAFQTRASAGTRYDLDEVDEAIALMEWLGQDHFVMLGSREYALFDAPAGRAAQVVADSGLGILRDASTSAWATPVPLATVRPGLREHLESGELLVVSRSNRVSTVHRQVPMVSISIKKVDGDGQLKGEYRLLGLFAQKAFAEPASSIPVLRRKLRKILEREDVVDHSYDERALRALFEAFPKHELFATTAEDLRTTLVALLASQRRQDMRLICRADLARSTVSALVSLPRGRFNAVVRQRVQDLLVERFDGTRVDYHLSLNERDQAVLHFLIHSDALRVGSGEDRMDELQQEVAELTRTFEDDLLDALVAARGEREGRRLAVLWGPRLPPGYADVVDPALAVQDLTELEALADTPGGARIALQRAPADVAGQYRVKLYKAGAGVELSSFLPLLESLGLVVVEEIPHRIEDQDDEDAAPVATIHDFAVRLPGTVLDVDVDGPRLAAALVAFWQGRAEADSLNRLVLAGGVTWEDVAVLRAYRRYRRQVGTNFTEHYEDDALSENPDVARALLALFNARFDPSLAGADVEAAHAAVLGALDGVARLDADRILRGFLALIDGTLRTNRWVVDAAGMPRPWLSFKFDSGGVPGMPRPVPYREIFVYAPDTEGVHLRGGPVARGGLRWSDRLEDHRTEVLGLMKAQMVKNAVIVPTGSKGGFVLKHPPADPVSLRAEVRRCYEVFVRGLLDLTDNVVRDGTARRVTPPPMVRRADDDDPYLVVAADRGTATFSDLANAISAEYGFWLGDAFASGGSAGYDHKAMGITARGAWVSVQRHFRELDIDVQTEPVSVVGIGDMSGDVFGNGLLRSRAVRLVAAFDHRDVFIDPDPDPEIAFGERARLFALPTSSWQDYDKSKISAGGGVFPRSQKVLPLTPQIQALLRTEATRLSPPELIRAVLCAPHDLLFAAGIGTFVKASEEDNGDVGDRTNDAIRVDAAELGARVVGEGGNLSMTQRARIQYARRGGRCNTDAIDNSAGVATSDREVNLKILLGTAIDQGRVDRAGRDVLLAAMTDEVAALVLHDNHAQTWVLSQELEIAPSVLDTYEALMVDLEEDGRLDREVEVLPTTAEIHRRAEVGAGLVRPELAVLLGYAKVDLTTRLLRSDLPDQPALRSTLVDYFPAPVVDRFDDLLDLHRLRRELVATVVANDLVNRMGITWVSRTAHELGAMAWQAAAAYWTARQVVDADALWRGVEDLDGVLVPALQMELKAEVDRLVDVSARAYLRAGAAADVAAAIDADRPAFADLEKAVTAGVLGLRRGRSTRAERWTELGVEPDVAERFAVLGELALAPDVAAVARASGQDVRTVAEGFFRLSESLPLDLLHARLQQVAPVGHWQTWQHRGLVDELRRLRRDAASAALAQHPDALGTAAIDRFIAERGDQLERVEVLVQMLDTEPDASLDAVAVATRALADAISAEPAAH